MVDMYLLAIQSVLLFTAVLWHQCCPSYSFEVFGSGLHSDLYEAVFSPPSTGASGSDIDAFVLAVKGSDEAHAHGHDASMMAEHIATLDLVSRHDATHVAVFSGQWNDSRIWHHGNIPGEGARVLIPEGVDVDYGFVSDTRLFTVRVDGALDFSSSHNSQIVFDTFVVSPTGRLVIGTVENPIEPQVNVTLIVANNGPIDMSWDPMHLSRGLISHGATTIHGTEKDSHEKVNGDLSAGDTSMVFDSLPKGWTVGDKIVIAGTTYDGYKWDNSIRAVRHYESEDEVRVISAIEDSRVYFDEPLEHNHVAPRDDLQTSVANYTRNVSIKSESGSESAVYERGHVMFMHNDNVDVRYMEFTDLGRTDKSERSIPTGGNTSVDPKANVQGRYSLHIHRAGTIDLDNPAILVGNAVFSAPGWGIVHHDSNAHLTNNATFDTFGSGFVAETGNEIGVWHDNIAIYAKGISWDAPKNTSSIHTEFDTGRGGEGFWFQGRLIEATDNVAASVNIGFAFFHRDHTGTTIDFDAKMFRYPAAFFGMEDISYNRAPILGFEGNETFAANQGLHVVKANTQQGHDVWTHLDNFIAWNVVTGVHLEYTSHYLLTNFDLVGRENGGFIRARNGIDFGANMSEIVVRSSSVDGFETGINLFKEFVGDEQGELGDHDFILIDTQVTNCDLQYAHFDARYDTVLSASQLSDRDPELDLGLISFSWADRILRIEGTKQDSIGMVDFAGGIDDFNLEHWEASDALNSVGYWETSGGQHYTLFDIYFTDRSTGEVFYETHPVIIAPDVSINDAKAHGGIWADIEYHGVHDIETTNGTTIAAGRILYEPM